MLCIPITGPDLNSIIYQLQESHSKASLLELRCDLFDSDVLKNLAHVRNKVKLPLIFTLRKKEEGGKFQGSEKERLETLNYLASLHPDYIDVEYDTPLQCIQEIQKASPNITIILSYHNFSKTPQNLEALLKRMPKIEGALYKIACTAESTNDALRMLFFTQKHAPLLGMCMGEKGQITRILGPIMGTPWIYASLSKDQTTAPGQLSAEELQSVYKMSHFNHSTHIYGLIGGSVEHSIGHFVHNQTMHALNLNDVYVKMALQVEELPEFFLRAKELGIKGLSVTMPLKERVMPFLDAIDPQAEKIGAVNTILFQEGKLIGYNTDGKGALDAIEEKIHVHHKKIAILGAGGAARAIIYEALQRGASIVLFNRTQERAKMVAEAFGIEAKVSLSELTDYDILINTTPDPCPIDPIFIRPKTLIMDIRVTPSMTPLLHQAALKECTLVFGYEMFIKQALKQYEIWFSAQLDREEIKKNVEREVLKHID